MSHTTLSNLNVAIVYDRVNTPFGGAENVLLALHEIFQESTLYTSVYDPIKAGWAGVFKKIVPSFVNSIPLVGKRHRLFSFFMPLVFDSFDFTEYDLILSVTSAEAKGVISKPSQLHVCYLLTPTRYLYSHHDDYLDSLPAYSRWLARCFLRYLSWWDRAASARPDAYIPISMLVQKRTKQYYHRSSTNPVYPPVSEPTELNLDEFAVPVSWSSFWEQPFLLSVCRLVPYKRVDTAIQVAIQEKKHLVVAGSGPDENRLRSLANSSEYVHFLGSVPQNQLAALYQKSRAVLMIGQEDFGIVGLEALSYGTPVIVHEKSGVAELILDQQHGIHLKGESSEDLLQGLDSFTNQTWSRKKLINQSKKYQKTRFKELMAAELTKMWDNHSSQS